MLGYYFTKQQIQRMANILDNAGQVFLAALVVPQLFFGNLRYNVSTALIGLLFTYIYIFWWGSLRLERKVSNYGR